MAPEPRRVIAHPSQLDELPPHLLVVQARPYVDTLPRFAKMVAWVLWCSWLRWLWPRRRWVSPYTLVEAWVRPKTEREIEIDVEERLRSDVIARMDSPHD